MFATRAGLAAQRDIIHVLVQAGATDGFIARLFVGQAARRGLVGAALGAGLALIIWIFISIGPGQGSVGWHGLTDILTDAAAMTLLCGAFGLICAISAGWSSLRQLSDERRRA